MKRSRPRPLRWLAVLAALCTPLVTLWQCGGNVAVDADAGALDALDGLADSTAEAVVDSADDNRTFAGDADTGIWCYFDGVKCSMCDRRDYCKVYWQTSCAGPTPECDGPVTCACVLGQDPDACKKIGLDTVKCEEVSPGCALLICDAGWNG